MELSMLILLYLLSKDENFRKSVEPLEKRLKNSQEMLSFLNDLSCLSKIFPAMQKCGKDDCAAPHEEEKGDCPCENEGGGEKENRHPEQDGVAEFLAKYFDRH